MIPEKYETNKQVKAKMDIDSRCNFLMKGHSHPKKVKIHHLERDKVDLYPSALALEQNPGVIAMYNGKVWRRGTRPKC